ncbi:DUF368 domain-containing protein [Spongiibacter sp. KMU-158]|uniref:DUF368 domain-containing protein n=2 Tax=Spongiibacter pelagi TaxID=2760804 RepID=A0A927GXF0_9GAMM|nr:DUF368 domain-containing protein [Spongiibacter pelagi]
MGAADVVPGVSGGTVAFITNIYDELIESIKSCNLVALKALFQQGPSAFWQHINGNFLLCLFLGIAVSVVSLAKFISYGLEQYPQFVSAFFFGLILASAWFVYRQIPAAKGRLLWLLGGVAAAIGIGVIHPGQLTVTPLTVFLSGALAICAMILPGISGSFILLLMGMYEPIIGAIKSFDITIALCFALGCACGLLAFVRVLSWLLHQHRAPLLALLTGILLGSLSIIWPWKALGDLQDGHGSMVTAANILPWQSEMSLAGIALCVLLMIAGLLLVLGLESISQRKQEQQPESY